MFIPEAIVIHCTATLAHQDFRRKEIDAMHKRRGFSMIGYHGLIGLDGFFEKGRELDQVGAHVQGFNLRTIGLSYVGGLRSSDAKPVDTRTDAQQRTMLAKCKEWLKFYPSVVILGHRDLSPDLNKNGVIEPHEWMKQCPCFDAAKWAKQNGLPGGRFDWKGSYVKDGSIHEGKFALF